jgi:hypothetical protein
MWIACFIAPTFFLVLLSAGNALERWVARVNVISPPSSNSADDRSRTST